MVTNPNGINQHTEVKAQNEPQPKPIVTTAEKIASQTGVSRETVKRNAEFAKAVDEVKVTSPIVAQKILTEEIKLPKQDVTELVKKPVIEQKLRMRH